MPLGGFRIKEPQKSLRPQGFSKPESLVPAAPTTWRSGMKIRLFRSPLCESRNFHERDFTTLFRRHNHPAKKFQRG
jgi:hypothetical protein